MEKVELSGKNAFEIFLDIICDFDILFVKQNIYNTGDYSYFFTTEKINKVHEILGILRRKSSLETAYKTLGSIKDERLSFFFGVKGTVLYYGFYNEDNSFVYKVGRFSITPADLRSFAKKKCLKTIRNILGNNNLKNLSLLQIIKVDFHTIFEDVENDVEIIDEYRVKNTFEIDVFNQEDQDENKLKLYLLQWSRNFKWSDKCYYIIHITEKYVHFYIKIKTKIQ